MDSAKRSASEGERSLNEISASEQEVIKPASAQECDEILRGHSERHFQVIYASPDKKRATRIGKVSVSQSDDGINFSLAHETQRDKVCGHLGTLASFVCFFENRDQSRPTIVHAQIAVVTPETGEFDVMLGHLGDSKTITRRNNLSSGWLLFRE